MAPRVRIPGGDLEYGVLHALWEMGRGSARDIHERVGRPKGLVYTTVAKVLDRLHAKGLVSRRKTGQAFVYEPKLARQAVEQARARQVLRQLLGPEPLPGVATLVQAVESIDPRLLDELQRVVAARRRSRHGS